jgi:hypothetical protein
MKSIQSFKFLSLVLAVALLASCRKKEDIEEPATFPNLAEILLNQGDYIQRLLSKDGYIKLSIFKPIGAISGSTNIYATFKDSIGRKSYGELSVGTYVLQYDPDVKAYDNSLDHSSRTYLSTLFGTKVDFLLKDKNGLGNEVAHKIYVPKALDVSAPLEFAIAKNTTFKWNADNTNILGVLIAVDFSPQAPGNERFTNVKAVTKTIQAVDNGSYTLDPNDFRDIPAGAKVDIALARGNLAEIKGLKTGNNYVLYTQSIAAKTYLFQ